MRVYSLFKTIVENYRGVPPQIHPPCRGDAERSYLPPIPRGLPSPVASGPELLLMIPVWQGQKVNAQGSQEYFWLMLQGLALFSTERRVDA